MNAHTPGPWRVDDGDTTLRVRQVNGPWHCVALVTGGVDADDQDTPQGVVYRANADILAAAPDLLKVLKVTAGNIRSLGPAGALDALPEPYRVWLAAVEEAIASAEVP